MSKNGENPGGQVKLICLPASPGTAGLYTGSGDHRTHSCPWTRAQIWTFCQWPPSFRSPWWRKSAAAAGPSLYSSKHGWTEWGETFSKKKQPLALHYLCFSLLRILMWLMIPCWQEADVLPCVFAGETMCWDESQVVELQMRAVKEHRDEDTLKTVCGCSEVKNLSFHFMERICWRGSCTEN